MYSVTRNWYYISQFCIVSFYVSVQEQPKNCIIKCCKIYTHTHTYDIIQHSTALKSIQKVLYIPKDCYTVSTPMNTAHLQVLSICIYNTQ